MGCEVPIVPEEALRWSTAFTAFNGWRGRCLHSFTSVEAEVSEAVLRLTARQSAPTYPHLAGQRAAIVLSAASDVGGHPDAALVAAMNAFQRHDTLRAALCHGRATVTLDRAGRWTAIFRLAVFRHRSFDRVVTVVEEREADGLLADLARDGTRLGARLRPWCAA